MKTLYEVCKPRESVFDESKRDDTLDLSNLLDDSIDEEEFFRETYITEGMNLLFDTAFKRFEGRAASGIIRLVQAMGGGKTHNMLALGLLARNKKVRKKISNNRFENFKGEINVVAYTGRETDVKFGIWGEIADQLGKRDYFKDYYSPLSAPGQSAWINLLKDENPTLILLDELPPYLQDARTKPVGTGTLADVTTTALANLFNAVNKAELYNVCIVVSDLQATYEEGSKILRHSFKELDNEIGRSAINIEPVGANTDDLYNILRTRLFEEVGTDEDVLKIIEKYKDALNEARQMQYTNYTVDELSLGIKNSYPFHPSIRDLFARFKENPGFQQTRGYIRLTRLMVKDLYTKDKNGIIKAKEKPLISAYDMKLNNGELVTAVKGIKSTISNAIAHDIADNGGSVAEIIDKDTGRADIQDISKLILVSSLGNVSNAIIGLSMQELMGYIVEPGRDITGLKQSLDEYSTRAWYLYKDKNNRLFFKDIKNVNAELISLVDTYSYDFSKAKIKEFLEKKFVPTQKDCYQEVLVFPSIDEIDLNRDKVTLVLTEPSKDASGLKKELERFFKDITYKNRVMFLTGQKDTMENLIRAGKNYAAINQIIYNLEHENKLPETDPQFQQALDLFDMVNLELLSSLRESFVTLYYPKKRGLVQDGITMEFEENKYDLEEQIKNLLTDEMKFDVDIGSNEFREKFEARIFTNRQMQWNHIKERAATTISWSWHHPNALDDLKSNMLIRGEWTETGGYVDKEPPAPETTVTVREIHTDDETGEVTLKLSPQYGDTVYYEIGQDATESSSKVQDITNFKTKELKLSFLCVHSKGKHPTGKPVEWVRQVKVKYNPSYTKAGKEFMELKANAPGVKILYTTDGSNPRENGGIYEGEIEIPAGAKFIQAIAVNEKLGIQSEPLQIEIKAKEFKIDKDKKVEITEPTMYNSTAETFNGLEELEQFGAGISGITLTISNDKSNMVNEFIELSMGGFNIDSPGILVNQLESIIENFFEDKSFEANLNINKIMFGTGADFERWVSSRKENIENYKNKIRQ